jgi:aryl-alcohol dehydrogenase-like predicted oxidoreductase
MLDALRATLQRLGTDRLDLWQIHFPFPTYPQSTLAEGLREAHEAGLVRCLAFSPVGLSYCGTNSTGLQCAAGGIASVSSAYRPWQP